MSSLKIERQFLDYLYVAQYNHKSTESGQEPGKQVTMEDCENHVYDKGSSIHHMF